MTAPVVEFEIPGAPAVIVSEPMRRLMQIARRAAAHGTATVLITGETGSGKDVVARVVHQCSPRRSGPWVDVNCAALPDHLIESELFGYEKGAFSGADTGKPGFFEIANGGTLFLDEIAELDSHMQAKLLRVLDEQPYFRLGGTRKIHVDVRVLAATSRNLDELLEKGVFRADLYHRLNQIRLRVPPLRDRLDDVVPLAEYFLRRANPEMRLAARAWPVLESHHWPGNVRELRAVIERAVLLAGSLEIGPADLDLERPKYEKPVLPVCSLEVMEREMIRQVLARTEGNQQKAAEVLGISDRTLRRKLQRFS
jgi:transcriptional regulator with PAS, ATPase and Fis domain